MVSYDLRAIGIALPGSFNSERTHVIHAYNLDFHDVDVKGSMTNRFPGVPIIALNDADAATVAEHSYGALKGAKTAVLLTLGTGVGGGLILGGKLFLGGMGHGVELGHMTLDYDGKRHDCGNRGCVEMYCNAEALRADSGHSVEKIIEGIRTGDPEFDPVIERYADALSGALVSIVHLLDPEVIALGGGIASAGQPLVGAVATKVQQKSFFKTSSRIVPAMFGNDAGLVGAAIAYGNL